MANTTNYNWETPDDTDLVKDGAAAIRTLGSSVDTTTKALNPSTTLGDIEYRSATANTNTRLGIGTTGQILSVVAGVPAWVANDVGDITEVSAGTGISVASGTGPIPVITNTVATAIDAKGDLIVGTGADTFSRLAVGTNTYILTADSAEATGLKWAAPAGGGGKVLQVLNTTLDSPVSTSSASAVSTTLSQAITPSAATSKVLIEVNLNGLITTGTGARYYLYKNGSLLKNISSANLANGRSLNYLDSPATTSATTYAVFFSTVSGTAYVNDYLVSSGDTISSITTLEIGA